MRPMMRKGKLEMTFKAFGIPETEDLVVIRPKINGIKKMREVCEKEGEITEEGALIGEIVVSLRLRDRGSDDHQN